ncbi:MAG: FAD-binding oxidoreductase, partial [Acidimicrobiales bacterium]
MERRDFLRLAGEAAIVGAFASGCSKTGGSGPPTSSGPTPSSPATSSTSSTTTTTRPPTPPTSAEWSRFGRSLDGRLVTPSSASYLVDAESYNPVFDDARPQAIAYVATPGDVSRAIGFGTARSVPISVRSGGHCYGGWSTGPGLVIDVSALSSVSMAKGTGVVSAGSGTRLVDLYGTIAPFGRAVPGGSCPTVGIAGLALGGGLGVLDRKFGLSCDNMVGADIVLASGELVTCDATRHEDLFWALRGAGGGSFGVVTELRFTSHPIGDLGLFTLVWSWQHASAAVRAWQSWAPSGPDELWSNCLLLASQSTPAGSAPVARVTGVYAGSQAGLEAVLAPFVQAVGAAPFTRYVGTAGYLDTMLIEAGCDGDTIAECHLPSENPAGVLSRAPFAARSDIVTSPLDSTGIATLLAAVEKRQSSPVLSGGGVALDASGGAINRVPASATAFVHRDGLYTMQYSANWPASASSSLVLANRSWLSQSWTSMRAHVSGQAY